MGYDPGSIWTETDRQYCAEHKKIGTKRLWIYAERKPY